MSNVLCDVCREQIATVFVTKIVQNQTNKQRLCESCARQRATHEGWMQHLLDGSGLDAASSNNIMMSLLEQADAALEAMQESDSGDSIQFEFPTDAPLFNFGEFPADEDMVDEMEEDEMLEESPSHVYDAMEADQEPIQQDIFGSDPFGADHSLRPIQSVRCSKCATTWDRLRQDGRVGCAHCYVVFEEQLKDVMNRVQRAAEHTGKHPRTAEKRRRRLEHLRARRDHRLDMLNRRLKEAVASEKYEDAAKLRDKIKIVASTIVSGE